MPQICAIVRGVQLFYLNLLRSFCLFDRNSQYSLLFCILAIDFKLLQSAPVSIFSESDLQDEPQYE